MPLGRSNTFRSKSRSPAPPTTPRHFLPPSHYAAAGGFAYPSNHHLGSTPRNTHNESFPPSSLEDYIPMSEALPEPSESESSFEFKPRITRKNSMGDSNIPPNGNTRANRQSTLSGLPNLEAQLLPSLQSTIDRMTRSPNRVSACGPSSSAQLDPQQTDMISHPPRYPFTSTPRQTTIPRPSPAPEGSFTNSNSSFDTPIMNTPKSKIPHKSALKSALRTPTPKLRFTESPKTSSPSRTSLRSVKSLLSRKLSGSAAPTPLQTSSPPIPPIPPDDAVSKPQSHTRNTNSSIPRPKARTDFKPTTSRSMRPMEDSDIENRYQQDWMEKRRLMVTNAEVFASGSSSESDIDSSRKDARTTPTNKYARDSVSRRFGYPHGSQNTTSSIGLGFEMPIHIENSPLLPNCDFGRDRDKTKILRFSLPPSDSGGSLYSEREKRLSYPGTWDSTDDSIEDRGDDERQRAALLGIVSELDRRRSMDGPATEETEDGSYWGEEGFAVSGSDDFASNWGTEEERSEEEEESVYEDDEGDKANVKRWERPHISSYLPPFPRDHGRNLEHTNDHFNRPLEATRPSSVSQLLTQRQHYKRSPPRHLSTPQNQSMPTISPSQRSPHHQLPTRFEGQRNAYQQPQAIRLYPHRSPNLRDHKDEPPRKLEATSIAQQSSHYAALQRQAFGLPPSESDELYQRNQQQRWSQSDSYRSSVGSSRWEWEGSVNEDSGEENLSSGAESLFRGFGPGSRAEVRKSREQLQPRRSPPRLAVISATSSASSMYDDPDDDTDTLDGGGKRDGHQLQLPFDEDLPPESWKPSIGSGFDDYETAFQSIKGSRETIIQEYMRSEEIFLKWLQTCVNLFILPLRVQNSRAWISGVPSIIARLFDWYEDILNLHILISNSLEESTSAQGDEQIMTGLAEYLKDFVPRLQIYQPYLIRLADATEEIVACMGDSTSHFGQFVRMQERLPQCENRGLESLLMEPVHRLAAYQSLFTRLLQWTPKTHPEYLSTFSLAHCTDVIVKVMAEVKIQESDYQLIKSLSLQIQDPAISEHLATRERRLLHSGTLRLITPAQRPGVQAGGSPQAATANQGSRCFKKTKQLAEAVSAWDAQPKRTNSVKSTTSSNTGASLRSFATTSSAEFPPTQDSRSSRLPRFRGLFSSKISSPLRQWSSVCNDPDSRQDDDQVDSTSISPDLVQAFVFSDLLLLVAPRSQDGLKYNLVSNFGVSRLFSIGRQDVDANPADALITLNLIPMNPARLNDGVIPKSAALRTVQLEILTKGMDMSARTPRQEFSGPQDIQTWLKAFHQCSQSTLQLLSFPIHQDCAQTSDHSNDTWLAVSSLVSSGLPMPKSPSGQLPDLRHRKNDEEARKHEREERGWWTIRYQQVLGETRRQERPLP